ncbi:hypothetical protein [Bradyrhizobium sp. 153]|uniref:alpha/beta hydrolase family protein n=1 Tax=Bradyrhizobium sp. 153 TaxID=2782627 RepID=UPI001FF8C04E|nr:hypothetical protein [Bradyrhizobium sp. 153]MCK1668922.1 hypothetical protein [Bradyrhizobium sp. 153]
MERAARWQLKSDLATIRERASAFLNNPVPAYRDMQTTTQWSSEWIDIAEVHSQFGEERINRGNSDAATEAWLCALTAYEVARRLITGSDQLAILVAGIERCIQRLEQSTKNRIERVRIGAGEPPELEALYLRCGSGLHKQAVICISTEQEPGAILFSRLLSATFNRKLSLLIISHDDLLHDSRHEVNMQLSSCLEYLSARPDVDPDRIGVYGDGISSALATDFAASDSRVAAAVCDGGLWSSSRSSASIGWLSGAGNAIDGLAMSSHRSQRIRQLRCPVLVVMGSRGLVSASEAVSLQAHCMAECIDLELAMAPIIRASGDEIENFVSLDDRTFTWLETKLGTSQALTSSESQFD